MNLAYTFENTLGNILRITDRTQDTDLYIPENNPENNYIPIRYFNFKYSETCTINVIYYHDSQKSSIVKTLYTLHDESKLDEVEMKLNKDGYYEIVHIILPTIQWLKDKIFNKEFNLSIYTGIYVTDGKQVYKYLNNELIQCEIEEIILVNSENTTISRCFKDFFCIWFLQNCYIDLSKSVLNKLLNKCQSEDLKNIIFKRDFIWMTLNVIKYYIEFNLLGEALSILEEVTQCNGFCTNVNKSNTRINNCGCHG